MLEVDISRPPAALHYIINSTRAESTEAFPSSRQDGWKYYIVDQGHQGTSRNRADRRGVCPGVGHRGSLILVLIRWSREPTRHTLHTEQNLHT